MAQRQRGGRAPVEGPAGQPLPQRGPVFVGDTCHRFVAQPGSVLEQPPAQVDILAGVQGLVETADFDDGRTAAHDRRAGHIGHRPVGHHRRLTRTEIQRGTRGLVAGNSGTAGIQCDDPRGRQRHRRIAEVAEQCLQPAAPGQHIGVQEGHEIAAAAPQSGVAGSGRPPTGRVADDVDLAGRLRGVDAHRYLRAVVDDHHPQSAQRGQQAVQSGGVVAHRDHHRHIAVGGSPGRTRVGDGGVQQRTGQVRAGRVSDLDPAA